MVRRKLVGKAPCRKCPKCGCPMVDLDYMCPKCGEYCEPERPQGITEYGTPE